MSLWCECLDCGGNGDAYICENGLMRARLMVAKAEQQKYTMTIVALPVFIIFLSILAMASGPSTTARSTPQAVNEPTARMTDGF